MAHPAEYGDFIGDAAVNFWKIAESFADTAASINPELEKIFAEKSDEIKRKYPREIKLGISNKSLLEKFELSNRYKGNRILYRSLNSLRRILNRLSISNDWKIVQL